MVLYHYALATGNVMVMLNNLVFDAGAGEFGKKKCKGRDLSHLGSGLPCVRTSSPRRPTPPPRVGLVHWGEEGGGVLVV